MLMSKYARTGVTSSELDLLDNFTGTIASSLPKATATELGFLKTSGANLSLDGNNAFNKTDTSYSASTTSASGLFSSSDKSKLDGVADNANNYTLPVASSSVVGGLKLGSGLQESSGVVSHGSDILNVYTDEVASSQSATNLGSLSFKHKSAGFTAFNPSNISYEVISLLMFNRVNGAGSNDVPNTNLVALGPVINNASQTYGNSNWTGGWGISNWVELSTHQHFYDDASNSNKAGGVELTIPSGFSTSNKILVTLTCPSLFLSTYHTLSDYHVSFRYQVGTNRFYEPYHSWGQTGDWDNYNSGQTYTVGTIGSEQSLFKNPSTSSTNTTSTATSDKQFGGYTNRTGDFPNLSYTAIDNIPTTSSFKIRPWFRVTFPFNTSNSYDYRSLMTYRGAPVFRSGYNTKIRITAIVFT